MLRPLSGRLPPGEFFGTFLLAQKACLKFLFVVKLQRMDAGNMDLSDDHFDIVMAAYVVTAVPDYRTVVDYSYPIRP